MKTVSVIGLGSNLNRPLLQLREACQRLREVPRMSIERYSDIYQSEPLLLENSPALWGGKPYLNAAVSITTDLGPRELLQVLKTIEYDMGRRPGERWAPRIIDLDILIFDNVIVEEDDLHIPHMELHKRAFACLPLLDVMPDYQHPTYPECVARNMDGAALLKKMPHVLKGPKIMGILNITPDSFSDGGLFVNPKAAINEAQRLFDEGADIIDIGAESTRPGATLIDCHDEWQRLQPILECMGQHWQHTEHRPLISIDTRHAETVRKALDYHIDWVNDQSQQEFLFIAPLLKEYDLHYVAMHHCGLPPSPNRVINGDPIEILKHYQREWLARFAQYDLSFAQLIIDPGIGFGKTLAQQMQILHRSRDIRMPHVSYLVGHSRKSFIKGFLSDPDMMTKEVATAIISARLAADQVDYLRVHEPKFNLAAIRLAI